MKDKTVSVRLSERRKHKLHLYAAQREKTITALIEDWVDSLKLKENKDNIEGGFNRPCRFSSPVCSPLSFPKGSTKDGTRVPVSQGLSNFPVFLVKIKKLLFR
jgi:hypothetical protein